MTPYLVIGFVTVGLGLASIFVAFGMLKGKIHQSTEKNIAQDQQIENLASKDDLAAAIKRSDEMLEMMRKRAEEDRSKGQGQYREFHSLIASHAERIRALETHQDVLIKSLDEMKCDIKDGFKDLQNELKELRKQRNGES